MQEGQQQMFMYQEYLEQQAQRHVYKQMREEIKMQQNIIKQQI